MGGATGPMKRGPPVRQRASKSTGVDGLFRLRPGRGARPGGELSRLRRTPPLAWELSSGWRSLARSLARQALTRLRRALARPRRLGARQALVGTFAALFALARQALIGITARTLRHVDHDIAHDVMAGRRDQRRQHQSLAFGNTGIRRQRRPDGAWRRIRRRQGLASDRRQADIGMLGIERPDRQLTRFLIAAAIGAL